MKKYIWHYSGDVNPEHGGYWYSLDNWEYGYVGFVRIVPCSEAGGPDNWYWVETGNIHSLDDADQLNAALNCCGMVETYSSANEEDRKHIAVDCLVSCGCFDLEINDTIQIGKTIDPYYTDGGGFDLSIGPDQVLRANHKIGNYARRYRD